MKLRMKNVKCKIENNPESVEGLIHDKIWQADRGRVVES
jgi:hypothetical protein